MQRHTAAEAAGAATAAATARLKTRKLRLACVGRAVEY